MKIEIGEVFEVHDYVRYKRYGHRDSNSYVLVKCNWRFGNDKSHHIIGRVWRLSKNSYRFVSYNRGKWSKGYERGRATTADQAVQKLVACHKSF